MSNKECKCQIPNTDLAGRCFKCGLTTPPMTSITQLPVEVASRITQSAVEYANLLTFFSPDVQAAWEAGATAYATKLHEAQKENEHLENKIKLHEDALQKLHPELSDIRQWKRTATKLLNEVFQKHESGLLPDRFIYEKIKTFLYGE